MTPELLKATVDAAQVFILRANRVEMVMVRIGMGLEPRLDALQGTLAGCQVGSARPHPVMAWA